MCRGGGGKVKNIGGSPPPPPPIPKLSDSANPFPVSCIMNTFKVSKCKFSASVYFSFVLKINQMNTWIEIERILDRLRNRFLHLGHIQSAFYHLLVFCAYNQRKNQLLQLYTASIAWSDSVFRSASISISVFMFVVTQC